LGCRAAPYVGAPPPNPPIFNILPFMASPYFLRSRLVILTLAECLIFSMKLPNGDRSEISMQKILGYCLNFNHDKGKDKARVFQSRLGITTQNADRLFNLIQIAAVEGEVVQESSTKFGKKYKVDWKIPNTESIELRTIWEISSESRYPRLISAFLKKEK
jgi:DNA gyrase/topoisomerase IV subunit A